MSHVNWCRLNLIVYEARSFLQRMGTRTLREKDVRISICTRSLPRNTLDLSMYTSKCRSISRDELIDPLHQVIIVKSTYAVVKSDFNAKLDEEGKRERYISRCGTERQG